MTYNEENKILNRNGFYEMRNYAGYTNGSINIPYDFIIEVQIPTASYKGLSNKALYKLFKLRPVYE